MSLGAELLKITLGSKVNEVHEQQKEIESNLTFGEKVKLRLAKKGNWITLISLGFAIAEQNPVDIVENIQIVAQWFF